MGEVAVIGGGVTGIQAALEIADHGITVHLIEREPAIGGHMAMLDKTFPTNDCSLCILSPKMADVARHPHIRLHTCTEVTGVTGSVGHFHITAKRHPRYIDTSRCTGCGDCIQICPVEVYNRFDAGMGVRKVIYKPHAQAIPDIPIKDQEHCIECGLCYDICSLDAIKKEDRVEEFSIDVASIVVATGYATFDPCSKAWFGYLAIPDVITNLEFERMISAGGPTGGALRRLSNGETPHSIVFIQCVGSRDAARKRPWCSGTCCMAAIKHAIQIKEKYPATEVTICYIDVRAYGKGYEEYYQRAERMGVRFLRGMPGDISLTDRCSPVLQVENTETREVLVLKPDLVVLSVGMQPAVDTEKLAERLGIEMEENGFLRPKDQKLGPVLTIRPGIYVAGTATAPKDIPDCVTAGGAAAMHAFIDATSGDGT
ncbi:MAG: CoB--CoM heterodisulfide reductase iron-sulfur subunit A family protein [Methanomicrobiales archaeon]|nr:CoB--CoM heterodisulfide reductase iron-sulfur subunit A family protein [Methanomicrobiales archaeon]